MKLKIRLCDLAEQDHQRSKRQYAHVLHDRNTICVCAAFSDLPRTHQYGILLHELAHLADPDEVDELMVDAIATEQFGFDVRRKSTYWGADLEWIDPHDVSRAEAFLGQYIAWPKHSRQPVRRNPTFEVGSRTWRQPGQDNPLLVHPDWDEATAAVAIDWELEHGAPEEIVKLVSQPSVARAWAAGTISLKSALAACSLQQKERRQRGQRIANALRFMDEFYARTSEDGDFADYDTMIGGVYRIDVLTAELEAKYHITYMEAEALADKYGLPRDEEDEPVFTSPRRRRQRRQRNPPRYPWEKPWEEVAGNKPLIPYPRGVKSEWNKKIWRRAAKRAVEQYGDAANYAITTAIFKSWGGVTSE